jgi:RNA polymerase sigma factor (sigma-70 family)
VTHTPTDGLLWARAGAGDREAFGRLYERHARAIYNYLFRRLADWSEAEDMTAVVFLEAWRRREVVVEEGMVRAWLFGIATNVARNRSRARRRHREALKRLPRPGQDSFADDLAARLDAQVQMQRVLAAVAALPEEQRDVVALCLWCELSYDEAAHALHVPVGTVRSRLSRARRALRELIAAPGHEEGMVRERHGALPG